MKGYTLIIIISALTGILALPVAASVSISWSNDAGTEVYHRDGMTLLTAGSPAYGDGTVLQLGYYTAAMAGAPFDGSWVALTGLLTSPSNPGTIGDIGGRPDGRFAFTDQYEQGQADAPPEFGLTPLAIRFYDSTSIATSTYFNAVSTSDGKFRWPQGPDGVAAFNLRFPTLVWQGGPDSAFRTTILVPEPSTFVLSIAPLMALTWWRRRLRHDQ